MSMRSLIKRNVGRIDKGRLKPPGVTAHFQAMNIKQGSRTGYLH